MNQSRLCWGRKVSQAFRERVFVIASQLGIDPDWLMACMGFESAGTFRADVLNAAGSGAIGLIQFMPQTAAALGTTISQLGLMSPERQLDYVLKYFEPQRGRIHSLNDLYMAILWPGAIGKPDDVVLFDRRDPAHPARYLQNAGLDLNRDGQVTRQEACARVQAMLAQGMRPENLWENAA